MVFVSSYTIRVCSYVAMGTSYICYETKTMYRSNIFNTHLAKVINFVCIQVHVLHFKLM